MKDIIKRFKTQHIYIQLLQVRFVTTVLIWFTLLFIYLVREINSGREIQYYIPLVMLLSTVIDLFIAKGISTLKKFYYSLALGYCILFTVLTIMDQMGILDIFLLALYIGSVVVLVKAKKLFK